MNELMSSQESVIIPSMPETSFSKALRNGVSNGTFPPLEKEVALVPVVQIPTGVADEALVAFLIEALKEVSEYHDTKCLQPYSTDGQRLVLQDDRYQEFAQSEKLGTNLPSDPDAEKEVVVRQIHCARQNHQKARRYLAQLLKIESTGYRSEIAYRLTHGPSYKVMWARDFALKYASVLSFYLSGVEIEYLPSPAPPSPQLDFLNWETPENLYVSAALVEHRFNKTLVPGFCALVAKKYTGQSAQELANDAIVFLGWCSLLREVARAQVHLFDQILDLKSRWWFTDQSPTRKTHRAEGIYGDWWGLPSLRQNPSRLRRNAAVYTASVDTAPVLKYNLNGYFSAAIHDSVVTNPPCRRFAPTAGSSLCHLKVVLLSVCCLFLSFTSEKVE